MRSLTWVVLLSGIASLNVAQRSGAQEPLPPAVEQAQVLIQEGDEAGAIQELESLLSDPAAPVVARELLGALYLSTGSPADALEILQPLIQSETPDPVVLFNVARSLHDLGRTAEGEVYLLRSAELAPRSPAAIQLARLRAEAGAHEQAIRWLEPMATGAASDVMEREQPLLASEVAAIYAEALLGLGEHHRALPYLEKVTRLAPSQPQGWERLGKALVELDRPEEAYAALSQAQELKERQLAARVADAARVEDLLQEATDLSSTGRSQEALARLREAQRIALLNTSALLLEVRLLIDLRQDAEALRKAEQLVDQLPHHAEAIYLRASARLAVQDLVAAEADFRQVLEQAPDHRSALNSLALLLMFTERPSEAEELLLQLLARWPEDPIATQNLRRIREKTQSR